jgi:type VI secretion system secreted protein Hcp
MAASYFLRLDGIPGESLDDFYPNQIQVQSWSWGLSHPVAVGSTAPKPSISDISFMKDVDLATAPLMRACLAGTVIKTGALVGRSPNADSPFLLLSFQQMRVTSVQDSASSEVPSESVSFAFNVVTYAYTQVTNGAAGTTKTYTYNVPQNRLS